MRLAFGLVTVLAMALTACSDQDIGRISGKVTLDGRPLASGLVVFENKAANIAIYGKLSPEGTYSIRTHKKNGLPPGNYQVMIVPRDSAAAMPGNITAPNTRPPASNSQIPMKYRNSATSGLTATVQAGDNPPFNFELVQKNTP